MASGWGHPGLTLRSATGEGQNVTHQETFSMLCLMVAEALPITLAGHGGLRLVADSWGSPGAPPVLLLHGGGQTRYSWSGTARLLVGSGFRVITADLRGHGESDWADDGDYSIDAFAKDITEISKTFDSRPAVVGASLGGLAALLAEGELSPGCVSALVLVDVAPQLEPEGVARITGFMSACPEGFESLAAAADAIAEYLPHRPRPADLSGLAKNLRLGADGRYRWHWDPAFLTGRLRPSMSVDRHRLLRAAASLKVPTMLVRGRESDMLSEEAAAELLAAAPHAAYADIAGARHMVAGDRNDEFANAVVGFLNQSFADVLRPVATAAGARS